ARADAPIASKRPRTGRPGAASSPDLARPKAPALRRPRAAPRSLDDAGAGAGAGASAGAGAPRGRGAAAGPSPKRTLSLEQTRRSPRSVRKSDAVARPSPTAPSRPPRPAPHSRSARSLDDARPGAGAGARRVPERRAGAVPQPDRPQSGHFR